MKQNKISQILFYTGVFIVGISFIFAVVNGNIGEEFGGFNWGTFFTTLLTGFISGMIFISLSEIIRLLHSINVKLGPDKIEEPESDSNTHLKSAAGTWVIDGTDWELANEMEPLQGSELIDIIATPFMRYGVVVVNKREDTLEIVVDFGGFRAEEVKDKEVIKKVLTWYDEHKHSVSVN